VPKDLDSLVIASQIAQAEAIKFFIEKWRSDKPRRSGIIWWNIRAGWPIISDAVMDYYNSKKLAYYFIKNVQRNICILISDNPDGKHLLMAVNDTRDSSMGSVVVTDVASGKLIYQGCFKVGINEADQIAVLPAMKGQGMLLIRYEIGKKKYSNHYLYGKPPFKLNEYLKLLRMADVYKVNIRTNMYAIR
jgi:beta-mannosidase